MADAEPTGALYDFLYRDSSRIASYYAQIFGGHLSSLEKTTTRKTGEQKSANLSIPVASGELGASKEESSDLKQIIEAHDIVATDILASLRSDGRIADDVEAARHGSLILATGTVSFIDRHMINMAAMTFDAVIRDEESKPRSQRDTGTITGLKFIRDFLTSVPLPSAFVLHEESGRLVAGTLKEDGMEEPISSYYFRHGAKGLANVHLVGVKEIASTPLILNESQLMGAAQQSAQALSDMLFPPDAIIVTPVAFFREL